ncbi:gamma-tubulin complex component 4 [Choristoneura fumiferana]|uniref:gamma-tubulin complex component 4 n=1 Tax=Choristoneura fumiferana TaxID=7141 RepID=UPI003D15E0B0
MIHDALLVLWDCSQATPEVPEGNKFQYANQGDADVYNRICEIAKSHHRIQTFVDSMGFHCRKTHSASSLRITGLYAQALSEGITEVLKSYKKTLVEVEGLVIGNHNYTLSFVYSYVEKFQGLFNTLNRLITTVKERRLIGCQILSLTHQHILNGNEMVHEAITKIFANINNVFMNQLCTWLLYGELRDPYQEFFIVRNKDDISDTFLSCPSSTQNDKSLLTSLQDATLDCGFILNPNMIPYFMPLSLAQEILFIGKTVILFGFDPRKVKKGSTAMKSRPMLALKKIGDSRRFTIWEDKEAEFHEKLQKFKDPESFEVYNLRSVVREIKECVTKHLWAVAVEEAQLIHELRLMKDFYLLGRGELFLELLRLTAHMLEKPTTRTGTRDMNQAFQLATRAVFLSNSADVEKFSFELPYIKPNTSANSSVMDETCSEADGWSSLILKYDFKWPLHLLFTPEVLARYNDMFRLLLRIKKTQHDLHSLWKTYKQSANFSMCQLHNKLMFLVNNLQHYMQADVLDTSFSKLMDAVNKTNDFEKLKKAHATFLADVLSQSFLTISTSANSDSPCDTKDSLSNPVFCNIMELLKLCHSFCNMSNSATDRESEDYYIRGYSERFNKLVKQLMQLLLSLRDRPCGLFLARLLMRLDYNRWLSGEAQLTQSVTNMLQ